MCCLLRNVEHKARHLFIEKKADETVLFRFDRIRGVAIVTVSINAVNETCCLSVLYHSYLIVFHSINHLEEMASRRPTSDDSEEDEFQENQLSKLHRNYRHAKEDRREFTLEKKDQLRMQK